MRCRAVEILSQPQTHTHNARTLHTYIRMHRHVHHIRMHPCSAQVHAHSARRPQMHANRHVRPLRAQDEQLHVENEKSQHSANFKIAQASHGAQQEQQAMPAIDHHEARPGNLFQMAQQDCVF